MGKEIWVYMGRIGTGKVGEGRIGEEGCGRRRLGGGSYEGKDLARKGGWGVAKLEEEQKEWGKRVKIGQAMELMNTGKGMRKKKERRKKARIKGRE